MKFKDKNGNIHDSIIDLKLSNRNINKHHSEEIIDNFKIPEELVSDEENHSPLSIDRCQRVVINYTLNEIILQDEHGEVLRSEKIEYLLFREVSLNFINYYLTNHYESNISEITKEFISIHYQKEKEMMKKLYQEKSISDILRIMANIINHICKNYPTLFYKHGTELIWETLKEIYSYIIK